MKRTHLVRFCEDEDVMEDLSYDADLGNIEDQVYLVDTEQ